MKKKNNNTSRATHIYIVIITLIISLNIYAISTGKIALNDSDVSFAQAQSGAPVKTALVYNMHKDRSTGKELNPTQLGQKFNMWIVSRSHDNKLREAKKAGNTGPALQYILSDAFVGAPGHESTSAQRTVCTMSQKNFDPFSNNINMDPGSFCEVHDHIVRKTGFDHDLNPSTPAVVPTEDWFLHHSTNNYRMSRTSSGGTRYYPNPGNQHVREYFAGRLINEKEKTPDLFDGIFLDNIALSWENVRNQGVPREYASSSAYTDAVFQLTQHIHQKVSKEKNYPVYANLISGNNNGTQWDRYISVLDGAMLESFALEWGKGPFSASRIESQMNQAAKWIKAGKGYIAVAQGTESNNANQAKFALAAFLMVTDGQRGYFHYTDYNRMYGYVYEYAEYSAKLGMPKADRVKVSSSPLVYRRDFQCGQVELNITNTTSKYTVHSNCSNQLPTQPTPQVTTRPAPPQTPPSNAPAQTIKVPVSEDSYVTNSSRGKNYGTRNILKVDKDNDQQTFLKFKLPVKGSDITKGKLYFKIASDLDNQSHSVSTQTLHLVNDSSWSEDSITYSNKPTSTQKLLEYNSQGQKDIWIEHDVTEALRNTSSNTVTFALIANNVDGMNVKSKEAGNEVPYLEITTESTPSQSSETEYKAEYFNNATLSGTPEVTKNESRINYDWGLNSPLSGINKDYFSVRWEKSVYFDAGTYKFNVTSDDGVRLYLDNERIIDKWIVQSAKNNSATRNVESGMHTIKIEYFENRAHAVMKFYYEKVDR